MYQRSRKGSEMLYGVRRYPYGRFVYRREDLPILHADLALTGIKPPHGLSFFLYPSGCEARPSAVNSSVLHRRGVDCFPLHKWYLSVQ